MLIGRLFGWLLVGVALLMASGDVVLALGPGEHTGLNTGVVVTLLSGYETSGVTGGSAWTLLGWLAVIKAQLMQLPAWTVLGPMGASLCWVCRRRSKRYIFRAI
jgi:hypothetical protein